MLATKSVSLLFDSHIPHGYMRLGHYCYFTCSRSYRHFTPDSSSMIKNLQMSLTSSPYNAKMPVYALSVLLYSPCYYALLETRQLHKALIRSGQLLLTISSRECSNKQHVHTIEVLTNLLIFRLVNCSCTKSATQQSHVTLPDSLRTEESPAASGESADEMIRTGEVVVDDEGIEWIVRSCYCGNRRCNGKTLKQRNGKDELDVWDRGRPRT